MSASESPTLSKRAQRLRELLEELFQYDRSDLNFGIYRVLNQRRDEIEQFLDERLMVQVEEAFAAEQGQDATLRKQLEEAEEGARAAGVDLDQAPKVVELRTRLADETPAAQLADEACADLERFFRRYYREGDFLSLRRYRAGTYAVPYEGEEVLLHWANRDQYYIKSSESLASYAFTLPSARVVRFRVVAADEEGGGFKPAIGEERRFVLAEAFADTSATGELALSFVYAPVEKGVKQSDINDVSAEQVLGAEGLKDWRDELATTADGSQTTVLARHLQRFTARNTYDYFVHKDLGGFLRRELDQFVKIDILRVDEIEAMDAAGYDRALARVRVVRRIAHQVIDFLAQVEEFQKRVWLKRKLVLEESWLVTLDLVPDTFYEKVAANDSQRDAWVNLLSADHIDGYTEPMNAEFLSSNPQLVLDTRHFDGDFVADLLASFDDLDASTSGVLVHGENFQALNLLLPRYRDTARCIFIDPPYNTGGDGFLYKDTYQHSSWLAMMVDRLAVGRALMAGDGALLSTIDDNEQPRLRLLLDHVFGPTNFVANIVWQKRYSPSNDATHFSDDHDHVLVYARDRSNWRPGRFERTAEQNAAYKNPDDDPRGPWMSDNYTANKSKDERPNLWYPIGNPHTGEEIWPKEGTTWRYTRDQHETHEQENRVWWGANGKNSVPRYKRFLSEVGDVVPRTVWLHTDAGHNQDGVRDLQALFGASTFTSPKPVRLMRRILSVAPGELVLDFFAGSGTLGHAVLDLARAEGGDPRRFVMVEAGPHFETVLRPRIIKTIHAGEWKEGVPVSRQGVSALVQCIRLESFDDALENVRLKRTQAQQDLLSANPHLSDRYLLRYLLDVETGGARLPADAFTTPGEARIEVTVDGVVTTVGIDLPATFTWLAGLRVRRSEMRDGVRAIIAADTDDRTVMVLWRDVHSMTSERLEEWFAGVDESVRGKLDLVYVNGDCTLERVRSEGEHWELRLIEEEFERQMFERADAERAGA